MIAGGMGNIRDAHVQKGEITDGACIVVLGGPAMCIGLGGGAASSMATGASHAELDFASVQRDNPEMQRRCQEVIDACWQAGDNNPILSIHDVGAGGLSNAIPELIHDSERGGTFSLRAIPNDEPGMAPLAIWCNESQERYVLAISPSDVDRFTAICERERCPFAIVGTATTEQHLALEDEHFANRPIDLPMNVLFGKPPKMHRDAEHLEVPQQAFPLDDISLADAAVRVLRFPTVADKRFLVTIGDRSITGMVARDQMVGPWQVAVADVAVTMSTPFSHEGEAMAIGERPPVALLDAAAAGRLAVAEAITNLAAARIKRLSDIKLSANWMVSAGSPGEDAKLYDTVEAIGMELCPALGIAIPVGKDSMSMRAIWEENGEKKAVVSPLSLVISGFAPVTNCRATLTPQLRTDLGDTALVLVDLGRGQHRMGASCLLQTYNALGDVPPDLDQPVLIQDLFSTIQTLADGGHLIAYHDRSDGGLWACLCEMAFAGHTGVAIQLESLIEDPKEAVQSLFAEELGVVVQVRIDTLPAVFEAFSGTSLAAHLHIVGHIREDDVISVACGDEELYRESRVALRQHWSSVSYGMALQRDDKVCAEEEFAALAEVDDPGMQVRVPFRLDEDITALYVITGKRPRIAILREQGVNGHIEMAAACTRAGFQAVDVHMSDLLSGRDDLAKYRGLVACGGFSYGDVLGAGEGWAKSILFHEQMRDMFAAFFARADTFGLGVCNGCQMMSNLKELIPGASHWPHFVQNRSERFEARTVLVDIPASPSVFLSGMAGLQAPVAVAHGEGRAEFSGDVALGHAREQSLICMRYVSHDGEPTICYPFNPNGSPEGIAGLCTKDGRFTIMMPHPERVFRTVQLSWHPDEWGEDSPWMRMFREARVWVD
jgi:phosphoribosylformylglycinamidine synthase